MAIVKVFWSGGKDSTCAVMKHIEAGNYVKVVCYIPMFHKNIPLITKKHYEFITRTADHFRSLGAEVSIITGMTYVEYVLHRAVSGKYKGQIFGFPCINPGQCGFKRDSKEYACQNWDVGEYDYEDIGIAYDEKRRHGQLNSKKRSILVELKITEEEAKAYDRAHGILSPHYDNEWQKRDGCALCPHAGEKERQVWFEDYPQAKRLVIKLQNIVKRERPDRYPLRDYKYFIEE